MFAAKIALFAGKSQFVACNLSGGNFCIYIISLLLKMQKGRQSLPNHGKINSQNRINFSVSSLHYNYIFAFEQVLVFLREMIVGDKHVYIF